MRRGLGEPEAARAFLEAGVSHPLSAWPGLARTAWRVLEHVERGSRITVHGDYDVDGVCSTAILVRALRTLGADVDWYLPSRIDDGYGLARATVERLAARGTQLLITVDCAVTAVEEVALARSLGHGRGRHRPPLAARGRRAARRAARAPARQRLSRARTCARRASRTSSRRRCWRARGRTRRWPTRTSTSSRWRPSPTSCRCRARTGAWCAKGLRVLAGHAQGRPARADGRRARGPERARRGRDRLPPRPAAERRGPALPRRRGPRAAADRGPRAGEGGRRRARRRQRGATRRRDPDPLPGRGAGGRASSRRPGARAGERGLASGRDRHRRVADRRAPPPPGDPDRARGRGGQRLRPLDQGLRPARRPARQRAATCCATAATRPRRA